MEVAGGGGDRDDRLNEVLLEYVEAIERGERRDQAAVVEAHPEFAEDLARFFADRRLVERMASSLLTDPSGHPPGGPADPGRIADARSLGEIGDFRLLREVGRGGMGVVYEAEQRSLRRRVALKVLPFAATFDPRHLQRFRNEAQAAAQLHHTAVVPIYAVGVESGVHYYAMQFIEGQSLAELIEGLRHAERPGECAIAGVREGGGATSSWSGGPTTDGPGRPGTGGGPRNGDTGSAIAAESLRAISTERRSRGRRYYERVAGLGIQAAEGLEHAHQVGIVHRDIKPANLLLDVRGDLWIADFGLALFRGDSRATMTGELVGTVRFMSPEQATAGEKGVDHRTDIYSLGITLYELATLTPAVEGRDRLEILRRIAHEEPRLPRGVAPSIPVDLETIILKAIAKDPADRYATAREMADDLRRFAADRPILARRPSPSEVLARWLRRHRWVAAAAVMALVVAVVGLSVFASILAREHAVTVQALDGQRRKANEAEELRAVAEANFLSAKRSVDFFVELSDEELLAFPPLMDVRRRLLEASVAYYRDLAEKRPHDPALRRELAASRARLDRLVEGLTGMQTVVACLLLTDNAVRREIGLEPEQARRVAALAQPVVAGMFGATEDPAPAPGARWASADAAIEQARRALASVLDVHQARRLDQLVLQFPGPHTFTNPETIRRLGLTEDQGSLVREIQVEAGRKMLHLIGPSGERQGGWSRGDDVWKQANEQIVELFTPDQKARWGEMTGRPFPLRISFPPTRREAPGADPQIP